MSMRRIIGIDPGLARVGIGLIETDGRESRALDWFTITTSPTRTLPDRLAELVSDLQEYIETEQPSLAVIERLFFATNKRTAFSVAQARGAILCALEQVGVPMLEPTPLELKMCVTGDGRADKRQVQDMVMRTLRLKERPHPDDAADALALALFGAFSAFRPTAARSVHARPATPLPVR